MFVFAHVFCGILIGLAFYAMTDDWRAVPACIMGAVLPDLLDKPLAILFPEVLGSGRTIGHSLLFAVLVFAAGMLLWRWRHTLLGIMAACALFSHQVLDAMWGDPAAWFWPSAGPFPLYAFPEDIWYFLRLQVTSISEWVFAAASLVILASWYLALPGRVQGTETRTGRYARSCAALLLGLMGVFLLFFALSGLPDPVFAPSYTTVTAAMAGLLALGGAIILVSAEGSRSAGRGFR